MRASVALLLCPLALAGCGSNTRGGGPLPGTGETLFVRDCGACHTLADAGTHGTVGSDLDRTRPTKSQVLAAIEHGRKAMPANIVSGDDAEAVAAYVAHAVRR